MANNICRWGILGTAGIARKNWLAISSASNATVTAVASRTLDSAERFIRECGRQVPFAAQPTPVAPYEALLARDDVDAVYIPLPTAMRHEWVIRAAEAGKHVLGEKPAASSTAEVAEMLAACRQYNVQYMDGVMFMHSQRLPMIRSLLADDSNVGKLRRLVSHFSFGSDEVFQRSNIRVMSNLEPFGCLGDLGWYCIRVFLWFMNGQMPLEVRARTLSELRGDGSSGSVPAEFGAELLFPGGVSASFYCSFLTQQQQWVHASGTNGYLRIDDFVLPFHGCETTALVGNDKFHIDNCTYNMEHHPKHFSVREYASGLSGSQEVRMIEAFSELVISGQLSDQWPKWTLQTQQILDACFESSKRDGSATKIAI